jgi:hypothetical protein
VRWNAWQEFAANSRKHLATPLTNNMGLKTVLSYRTAHRAAVLSQGTDTDPFAPWKEARRRTAERLAPLTLLLAAASVVLFARRFRGEAPWLVAAAAVGLVPFTTELTSYYAAFLLVPALLVAARRVVGLRFAALALFSCVVPFLLSWDEDRYALTSLAVLVVLAAAASGLGARLCQTLPAGPGKERT